MRRIQFSWLLSGLIGLLLLCGCHRQDSAAASAAPPRRTSITALIWAPDWPEQMLQIAAEFSKLNPEVHVDVQFMIGNSVEEVTIQRVL